MINRKQLGAIGFGVGVLAAIFVVAHQGIGASQAESDLEPVPSPVVWPANQAWSWSFKFPGDLRDGEGISLLLRSKSSTDENLAISSEYSGMSAADAEHESVTGYILPRTGPVPQPVSGTATIQLLDLATIGAASVKPGADLRVLGSVNVGGTEIELSREDIFLPPGHFVSRAWRREGRWRNHELYLMTFLVQQNHVVVHYDVFLKIEQVKKSH